MGDNIIDYRAGISNKMVGAMLDSNINPTTGKPFANEEAKQTWMQNYDKPVEKQSKGFFKRLKDALFAHGGPVKKKRGSYMGGGKVHRKKYAKGGGVRKATRYK